MDDRRIGSSLPTLGGGVVNDADNGLHRHGPVVVLSGSALQAALDAVRIAVRVRRQNGYADSVWLSALIQAFGQAAMSATGHSDVRESIGAEDVSERPTVPLDQAARRLNIGERQARRLAPQLGGQKIGGRWFVDKIALDEHIEGRNQTAC